MMLYLILGAAFLGVACLVGGVATILFRSEGSLEIENRLDVLTGAAAPMGKDKKEAALLSSPLNDGPSLIEEYIKQWFNLRAFLQQADVPLTPSKFIFISLAMGVAGMVIVPIVQLPLFMAPLGAILALLPLGALLFKRKRRLAAFAKQLPEALELISRALRAGHSLASGFKLVADEMDPPVAKEFGRCYEAQNLGIPLDEAIEEMTERVPNLDLRFFATAVVLQRQTGGDLAEILDKIGYLVRERFKIWGQIQALTGEGRLSGVVLLSLPPVLFVVMWRLNPNYCMALFTDPMGHQMLVGAILMQIIGALVIRKIVNIKV
ncbi:MAG: type II secretion system F family protein [Planctomycetaceae bacterium]|nr:type II secretion system F family protein [Planctomycetaceae bacterium]